MLKKTHEPICIVVTHKNLLVVMLIRNEWCRLLAKNSMKYNQFNGRIH